MVATCRWRSYCLLHAEAEWMTAARLRVAHADTQIRQEWAYHAGTSAT